MPKNTKGGNKAKKGRNSSGVGQQRQLVTKSEDQEYARVKKLLGDCRLLVITEDGHERLAVIRGKFRNKVWIRVHDVILVSLRDFDDNKKVDVIHKYDESEVHQLKRLGEIELILNDRSDPTDESAVAEDDVPFDFSEI